MAPQLSTTDRDPLERVRSRRIVVVATVVVAVGGFFGSIVSGTPEKLPGVALESALLLHVERSLAVAGAVAGVHEEAILKVLSDMESKRLALAKSLYEDLDDLKRRGVTGRASEAGGRR